MLAHRYRVLPRMNFSSPYVDLPKRLTVARESDVYRAALRRRRPVARIDELSGDLHLAEFLDRPTGSLSAGQKTRVALAKALINRPELLLLDEPTASLDPDTADWVRGYLEAYRAKSGATILLASHNMAEVERLCDDVLMMSPAASSTAARRTSSAPLRPRNLEEVFLDIARAGPHRRRAAAARMGRAVTQDGA